MAVPIARAALSVADGAGRHGARNLVVPANLTRPTRPPCSPKLHPVETIRPFPRQNHLANRLFDSADAIVAVCRNARNAPLQTAHLIASITSRDRAQVNG
jgi:hypothetical protein